MHVVWKEQLAVDNDIQNNANEDTNLENTGKTIKSSVQIDFHEKIRDF